LRQLRGDVDPSDSKQLTTALADVPTVFYDFRENVARA
jgi:hypothetical protein